MNDTTSRLPDTNPELTPLISPSSISSPERNQRQHAVILDDDRAIQRLIELLLDGAGLPSSEIARRLGIRVQSLNQYRYLRRKRPSIQWMSRLAQACGGRLILELPERPL